MAKREPETKSKAHPAQSHRTQGHGHAVTPRDRFEEAAEVNKERQDEEEASQDEENPNAPPGNDPDPVGDPTGVESIFPNPDPVDRSVAGRGDGGSPGIAPNIVTGKPEPGVATTEINPAKIPSKDGPTMMKAGVLSPAEPVNDPASNNPPERDKSER